MIGGESTSITRYSSIAILKDQNWTIFANLSIPLSRHCSVIVNDRDIYMIGGYVDKDPFSGKTITFNLKSQNFYTIRSEMKTGRQLHSCSVIDTNKIIAVGGHNFKGSLKTVEVFYTSTQRWTEFKSLEFKTGLGYGHLFSFPLGECAMPIVLFLFTLMLNLVFKYYNFHFLEFKNTFYPSVKMFC